MAVFNLTPDVTSRNPSLRVQKLPPGPCDIDLSFDTCQFAGSRAGHPGYDTVSTGCCVPPPAIRLLLEELRGHAFAHMATPANLRKLPPLEAKAFVYRYWNDLHYNEIASELGISENNARTLVCRARQHLEKLAH